MHIHFKGESAMHIGAMGVLWWEGHSNAQTPLHHHLPLRWTIGENSVGILVAIIYYFTIHESIHSSNTEDFEKNLGEELFI